jgi:uncharacterized protein DUF397
VPKSGVLLAVLGAGPVSAGWPVVLVRDTTDRDGQTLAFTAEAWRAFAEELKCPFTGVCLPE